MAAKEVGRVLVDMALDGVRAPPISEIEDAEGVDDADAPVVEFELVPLVLTIDSHRIGSQAFDHGLAVAAHARRPVRRAIERPVDCT